MAEILGKDLCQQFVGFEFLSLGDVIFFYYSGIGIFMLGKLIEKIFLLILFG